MSHDPPDTFGAYIAGEFCRTENHREIHSPYDGRVVATVCDAGPAEIDAALDAAVEALPATHALTSEQRANICAEVARSIRRRRDELALAICDEAGKPIADAEAEVERAVFCFELAAGEAGRADFVGLREHESIGNGREVLGELLGRHLFDATVGGTACFGDSGGPALVRFPDGSWHAFGIAAGVALYVANLGLVRAG